MTPTDRHLTPRRRASTTHALVALMVFSSSPAQAAPPKGAEKITVTSATPHCKPSDAPPLFIYEKGPDRLTDHSRLTLWVTIQGCRLGLTARAGSGLIGEINDCLSNRGNLPDGGYTIRRFFEKRGGSTVVRGSVWHLSNHKCVNQTVTRSALFIHTNGIEGKEWDGKYATNGCIELSQADRGTFADYFHRATRQSEATLQVFQHLHHTTEG